MKRFILMLLLGSVIAAGSALGEENFVTIYSADLGLVRQIRSVDVQASQKVLRFTDVASKLIPESVHLRPVGEHESFRVIEQSYEYDLASPERVLSRTLGKPIEIITADGALVQGILLNTFTGSLLLKTDDGVSILPWNDKMLVSIKGLPEGLVIRPTLVWHTAGLTKGKWDFEVSYLTEGLHWDAAYVGILNEKSTSMAIDTWASIRNESGKSFKDARLRLVAGEVRRAPEVRPLGMMKKRVGAMAAAYDSGAGVEQREIFEYHVYELGAPTTLNDKETKLIALQPPVNAKAIKEFIYNNRHHHRGIGVRILLKNDKKNGLGNPLPAGTFRVYQKDKNDLVFIGEQRIAHTARNEDVKIAVGNAFDLAGERKVMETRRVSDRSERQHVSVELRNNKQKDDVSIIVEESSLYGPVFLVICDTSVQVNWCGLFLDFRWMVFKYIKQVGYISLF